MKNHDIAILILAHHNPEHLSLLINQLKNDFDVYVQIDKKSKLSIEDLPKHKSVSYYKAIEVYWGHVSQVYNMEFIFRKAFAVGHKHYCMISGDDFPVKSNTYIKDFFLNNENKNFMYSNPLPIKTWGFNHGFDRLDRYWFMKSNNRKIVKILGRITLGSQRLLGIKIKRYPINYYAGSNWINITHDGLRVVFNFIENNPKFLKKLKHSRATDEIWIQSILMNSNLKHTIVNDDLRYIDWEKGPSFPRILDMTDLKSILKSKALFGRKFNCRTSDELYTILKEEIACNKICK